MRDLIDIVEAAEDWNGKQVVGYRKGYRIVVDDPDDATYVTAWTEANKKVGSLATRRTPDRIGKDYLSISLVEVDQKHRRNGLAEAMFKALLAHLDPRWKGISSYLPDQVDTKAVPTIWRRLGGRVHPDNADFIVVDRAAGIDLVEGMRLDEASPEAMERKERARKLGFDVSRVLYHGTGSAFAAFKRGYNGTNMGAGEREPFAVWLTSSADVAGVYADASTKDVEHFVTGELLRKGDGAPNIMPLYVRSDGFRVVDCTGWTHFKLLREKGFILRNAKEGSRFYGPAVPGVIFKNAEDGSDHRSDIYAVFNPARVRSVFAAFDPAKKNSTDLLA